METNIEKFYKENLKFIGSKDVCKYEDEKGNIMILPISNLVVACEYKEMEEPEYKQRLFNKELDKDIEYNKKTITKQKNKFEITGNEKDKNIITDAEVEVYEVWFVRNGLKLVKSFNNKDEAIKLTNEINDIILKNAELIK